MKKLHSLTLEQRENVKHGETFFPVQRYITPLTPEHPAVTLHWHEEAEFTRILSGSCRYQIDLVEYRAQKGDLLFIPPLELHSITLEEGEEYISETYVFHMNFLGGNATDICSTRYLTPLMKQELSVPVLIDPGHPAYPPLNDLFSRIACQYREQAPGYELTLKALFLLVICQLLPHSERKASPPAGASSRKLKTVLDYIELHYASSLCVAELAGLCYFSESHFMRFFKKHMNMTCLEYINNLRLEKSVELFEQGETSILDVSLSVGFHNLSYFHRAFRKKYHTTPLSFIKQLNKTGTKASLPAGQNPKGGFPE